MEMTEIPQKLHNPWEEVSVDSFKLHLYFLLKIFEEQPQQ